MRRALPLLLALVPGAALAGKYDFGADGARTVEISGPVEVPLYRGPSTNGLPAVWVEGPAPTTPDGVAVGTLALIDVSGWTTVSKGFAEALGVKAKKDRAILPELRIGSVVLRDVRVKVVEAGPMLVLGVGTLEELGVALLSSAGVLKMVPAADAQALVASVGTPVEAVRTASKKWFEHGHKVRTSGVTSAIQGSVAGADGFVRVQTYEPQTQVAFEVPLADARAVAGVPMVVSAPVVAGVKLPEVWVGPSGRIVSPDGKLVAFVGFDALYSTDIAVAPDQIALKVVSATMAADPRVIELADAKKSFDIAEAAAAAKAEEKVEVEGADSGLPATVGRNVAYGDALVAAGRPTEAIAYYRKAADVAGDNCLAYLSLGRALLVTGDAQGAATAAERAGGLWDRWYAQDVDTRALIAKKKKGPEGAFLLPQPSACHTAWGDAAEAHLALGHHDVVAALYAAHTDLDADLPLAYGLSLLAQGKTEEANGPIRRAIAMGANGAATRTALALAHPKDELSYRQVERVAFLDDEAFAMIAAVEASRRAGGDAIALAGAQELVKLDPLSVQARLVHAIELKRQGKVDELAQAMTALEPMVAAFSARNPNDPVSGAYAAVALALKGDAAAAKAALAAHVASFGATSPGLVAQALVASIGGDGTAADAALAALRATDPLDTVGLVDLSM